MKVTDDHFLTWLNADYPRPNLCRTDWLSLNGTWDFREDPADLGVRDGWFATDDSFADRIQVPFPPGSPASGWSPRSESEGPADIVWYRRHITPDEIAEAGDGPDLLIHFEAVDFHADVWVNGQHRARHTGGYTPFAVRLSRSEAQDGLAILVRAEDHRQDVSQPHGKQDWRSRPHGIWYQPQIGIWRDVWMEAVPALSIDDLHWDSDIDASLVTVTVGLSRQPQTPVDVEIELSLQGDRLARAIVTCAEKSNSIHLRVPTFDNRHEWDRVLWSPAHPNLIDARVRLLEAESNAPIDRVVSYLGARKVTLDNRHLLVNHRPQFQRGVLDQGYWQESYFAAPNPGALRQEVELIRDLGFNMSRIHERTADRRYLSWADVYGIMLWAESASANRFDDSAVQWTLSDWQEVVLRDRSHPSVILWVPFNESWGVPNLPTSPAQQALVDAAVALTRALDPSRPVIANDGWEQLDTDIVTTHDYASTGRELEVNYRDFDSILQTVTGTGPQGRKILLRAPWHDDRPVMVSEFGGLSLASAGDDAWGYEVVQIDDYARVLGELFEALYASPILAGVCYTQLTDTGQETNGLCFADRTPKVPVEQIRGIITNTSAHRDHIRPRAISEAEARPESEGRA